MTALLRMSPRSAPPEAAPACARVCSKVGMKPVPPLPPTTSEAAAAPYRAAVGRLSPSTSRAVSVPTKASPAPVWSTTAGAGMASIQADSVSLSSWIPSAPQVTATLAVPSARSLAAASCGRGRAQQRRRSPGKDGVTRKACGASSARAAVASSTEVSRGRKLGSKTKRRASSAALKTAARDVAEMAQAMPPAITAPAAANTAGSTSSGPSVEPTLPLRA